MRRIYDPGADGFNLETQADRDNPAEAEYSKGTLLGSMVSVVVIVLIDAIGTQKAIATEIIDGEADYVLGLKRNQSRCIRRSSITTAKSLASGRHGPRQVGQILKTKPLRRSCLRILDQSLEPRKPALQATGRLSSPVRSPGFPTANDHIERPLGRAC